MIASPAIPSPAAVPHPFALDDLRMHSSVAEEPSSTSALTLYGLALAVVLAIGAFIWLDPLRLFTPTEATPPAPAFVPSAEPARLIIERQEIIAPRTAVPATKSVEVPIAPVVRPRAASIKPETRGKPMDRTNPTVLQASPKEKLLTKPEEETALPALVTKPEERMDAPIVLKLGDDTKTALKPAATNDQTPVTE